MHFYSSTNFYLPDRFGCRIRNADNLDCILMHSKKYNGRMFDDIKLSITRIPKNDRNTVPRQIMCEIVLSIAQDNQRTIGKFLKTEHLMLNARATNKITSLDINGKDVVDLAEINTLFPTVMRFIPSVTKILRFSHIKFSQKQTTIVFNNTIRLLSLKFEKCILRTENIKVLPRRRLALRNLHIVSCGNLSLSDWQRHPSRLEGIFAFIYKSSLFYHLKLLFLVDDIALNTLKDLQGKYPFKTTTIEYSPSLYCKPPVVSIIQPEEEQVEDNLVQETCWKCSIF
ncbi:unnamed protein product [Moneuplotes crassus]|uniref:Uncharacterized protein n=1 Tax=Euplotes crassus TaxID=5936 RepID=A0AAD1XRD6_EUPCR|nr:unnamed protein product [Moneuplotes crassus]